MPAVQPATVVSLFSGAGGLDVGLERAGWETVVATDVDADCVATLRESRDANLPVAAGSDRTFLARTAIVQADIADLHAEDLRPTDAPSDWRPSLVAGGPPCQPWSSAGLQRGFSDPRGQLVEHFIRLVAQLRPHFVLMENVRGLVTAVGPSGKPGEALQLIQRGLEKIGYASAVALLNAADYGAAQRRVRLFLVASCDHSLASFPVPSHQAVGAMTLLERRKPWISLGELLATLPAPNTRDIVRPKGERAQQLASLEPGTGLRTEGRVESNRPGGHWGYRQDCFVADLSLPSRTIRAATTPDWIREPDGSLRRLTWRECAALQGFPGGWQFAGTVGSRFRQIGNGVQTTVAEAIARALLTTLSDGPADEPPESPPWPAEFHRRIRYTVAEHRVNGEHRVRVRASV
jgi:DNA (cytosine-5)-methyltransferase 1